MTNHAHSESSTLPGMEPGWTTLNTAREHAFTGEIVFESEPEIRVYLDNGVAYFAERASDPPLARRLIDAGVVDAVQLDRGTVRVGDVQHLGRLFDRDPSVDRDAVMVATEELTERLLAELANNIVASSRSTAYRHHPSGLHRWFVTPIDAGSAVRPVSEVAQIDRSVVEDLPGLPIADVDDSDELRIEWDQPDLGAGSRSEADMDRASDEEQIVELEDLAEIVAGAPERSTVSAEASAHEPGDLPADPFAPPTPARPATEGTGPVAEFSLEDAFAGSELHWANDVPADADTDAAVAGTPTIEFDELPAEPESPSPEFDELALAPEAEVVTPEFDELALAPEAEVVTPEFDELALAPEAESPSPEFDELALAPEPEVVAPEFEELTPEPELISPEFDELALAAEPPSAPPDRDDVAESARPDLVVPEPDAPSPAAAEVEAPSPEPDEPAAPTEAPATAEWAEPTRPAPAATDEPVDLSSVDFLELHGEPANGIDSVTTPAEAEPLDTFQIHWPDGTEQVPGVDADHSGDEQAFDELVMSVIADDVVPPAEPALPPIVGEVLLPSVAEPEPQEVEVAEHVIADEPQTEEPDAAVVDPMPVDAADTIETVADVDDADTIEPVADAVETVDVDAVEPPEPAAAAIEVAPIEQTEGVVEPADTAETADVTDDVEHAVAPSDEAAAAIEADLDASSDAVTEAPVTEGAAEPAGTAALPPVDFEMPSVVLDTVPPPDEDVPDDVSSAVLRAIRAIESASASSSLASTEPPAPPVAPAPVAFAPPTLETSAEVIYAKQAERMAAEAAAAEQSAATEQTGAAEPAVDTSAPADDEAVDQPADDTDEQQELRVASVVFVDDEAEPEPDSRAGALRRLINSLRRK